MTEHEEATAAAYMTAMNALSELFELGAQTQPDREHIERVAHHVAAGRLSLVVEADYTGGQASSLMFHVKDDDGKKSPLFGFFPKNSLDS